MFVGQIKGAFDMVAVIACVIFGSLTGSAPATVAAIGTIMIPLMIKDNNYPPHIAAGLVATSGTLGNIIPPSIALIL